MKPKRLTRALSLCVTPGLYEQIEHAGDIHQLSVSEILRTALTQYLYKLDADALNLRDKQIRQGLEPLETKKGDYKK